MTIGRERAPQVGELPVCAGCRRNITDRRYLRCRQCSQYWDIDCGNVPECRFFNTMSMEHKSKWICPECTCNQRRMGDNSETPVKASADALGHDNITMRRNTVTRDQIECMDESGMSLDMSHIREEDATIPAVETARPAGVIAGHAPTFPPNDDATLRIINEIQALREEMREEQKATRAQIAMLNDNMVQLTGRIARCEEHVGSLEERVRAVEQLASHNREIATARIDDLEHRLEAAGPLHTDTGSGGGTTVMVAELERTVSELRLQLNERDQEALLSDLEIGQLPEAKGENVVHSVTVLAGRLGVTLEERDIVFAERVGAPPAEGERARRVVVRLARRQLRDQLLQAARVRRTVMAESGGRVFINERLTRSNRLLFHRVREECRRMQWRYSWTRRGRIFARKADGAQVFQLRSLDDITRVFGLAPVA